eukprot:NODE_1110_length_672_cov_734.391653_g869_i0.p1 GENE.NODE_1110_length_672_cov_734.391653_g869_i0~~NODE_1110_length_672_cov_734.391653_g869_i0.p1  ORF type:complete len:159 (+),score=0.84 NODE_1110_length_672_cov_734.391653_g869_i0:83-559(+)
MITVAELTIGLTVETHKTHRGRTVPIHGLPGNATVRCMKRKLQEKEGVNPDHMRLIHLPHGGFYLEDTQLLVDCGIGHESTVHWSVRDPLNGSGWEHWSPAITVHGFLTAFRAILETPNLRICVSGHSCYNKEASEMYRKDKAMFTEIARKWTRRDAE